MNLQHALPPGTLVDNRFKVIRLLGAGAMGAVYLATEVRLDRTVALKLFFANTQQKRFEQECQALASIESDHLPRIYCWGMTADPAYPYLAMEFIKGRTLQELFASPENLPEEELRLIFCQLCDALSAVHSQKIVHRDLKPGNIMLSSTDSRWHVWLTDFGVIHRMEQEHALTESNEVIGSLNYLSPEHFSPGT